MSSDVSTPPERPRRSFFADLLGGFADLTAPLWRSWWDKAYYRSLLRQSGVAAFSFLVVFVAVGWFLRVPIFREALREGYNARLDQTIKSVYIENGRIHTPNDQNIVLGNPKTKEACYVISPRDEVSDADAQTAVIIAKSDRLLARQRDGTFTERTYTELLDGKTSWRVDDATMEKFRALQERSPQPDFLNQAVSRSYNMFVFTDLLARLVEALALGLIVWLILKKTGPAQPYPACIRLAIVAMAPGLLLNFFTDRFGLTALTYNWLQFFGVGQLPFWALTAVYLAFAVRAVRTAPGEPAA